MSLNSIETIVSPKEQHLNEIIRPGGRLDIVSPFFSGWTLSRLNDPRFIKIRLITRLPKSYYAPPAFVDNDPAPLRELMTQLGSRLEVYGDPEIHAKLYVGEGDTWLGSANFTRNGFSGKGELLIRFGTSQDTRKIFSQFLKGRTRIKLSDVSRLEDFIKLGLTSKRKPIEPGPGNSADLTVAATVTLEDFAEWLSPANPTHLAIINSLNNKNRMVGHAYSAFNGVLQFLLKNTAIAKEILISPDAATTDMVTKKLTAFIVKNGDKYGGPRGGTWRSKLSTKLGGMQTTGGAGDTVVRRFMLTLPAYMRQRSLI